MNRFGIVRRIDKYRFEFLLVSLLLLLFDKVFFPDNEIYLRYVWPLNMLILSVSSIGLFRDKVKKQAFYIKNTMGLVSVIIPFVYEIIKANQGFLTFMIIFFIGYYSFLFFETLSQIVKRSETNLSVLLGSMCGYLLLILIALFNFMLIELIYPHSFSGITTGNTSNIYNELNYFTFTLITSTGFGDIIPLNDSARLSTSFFSVAGQFYMVALVGIIISRFNHTVQAK